MPRPKTIKSYLVKCRITESACPKEDIEYYERKLDQGYTDTKFLRDAVNIARRFEDGSLLREQFIQLFEEKLPEILMKNNLVVNPSFFVHDQVTASKEIPFLKGEEPLVEKKFIKPQAHLIENPSLSDKHYNIDKKQADSLLEMFGVK